MWDVWTSMERQRRWGHVVPVLHKQASVGGGGECWTRTERQVEARRLGHVCKQANHLPQM